MKMDEEENTQKAGEDIRKVEGEKDLRG